MRRLAIVITTLAGLAAATAAGGAHAAGSAAKASGLDKEYLKTSIEGDRFEITGGKLALKKSNNTAVRALATRLVADHSKSLADSLKAAKSLGVKAPSTPSESQQWELKIVGTETGKSFDRWYSDLEVRDHIQDLQEAADEVSDGSDATVRSMAKTEMPTLREHLTLARAALKAS